jgi:hypothetical protein
LSSSLALHAVGITPNSNVNKQISRFIVNLLSSQTSSSYCLTPRFTRAERAQRAREHQRAALVRRVEPLVSPS